MPRTSFFVGIDDCWHTHGAGRLIASTRVKYAGPSPALLQPTTSAHSVFAQQPDRAGLRPLVPRLFGERHARAHRKPGKAAIEHAVLVKVNFPAIGSFEEAKAFGEIERDHCTNGLVFVSLDLSLHAADMILQAPPRPLERIVDGEIHICIAVVLLRRARNVDLPTIWQGESDVDLVKSSVMVAARCLKDDAASGNASTSLLDVRDVSSDGLTKPLNWLHTLKINLKRRFHGVVDRRPTRT